VVNIIKGDFMKIILFEDDKGDIYFNDLYLKVETDSEDQRIIDLADFYNDLSNTYEGRLKLCRMNKDVDNVYKRDMFRNLKNDFYNEDESKEYNINALTAYKMLVPLRKILLHHIPSIKKDYRTLNNDVVTLYYSSSSKAIVLKSYIRKKVESLPFQFEIKFPFDDDKSFYSYKDMATLYNLIHLRYPSPL
jgi:hypothetical protein